VICISTANILHEIKRIMPAMVEIILYLFIWLNFIYSGKGLFAEYLPCCPEA